MATLKITRDRELFSKFRDYRIIVDGLEVGRLASGKSAEFIVAPGRHSLVAKIDWCSSSELKFELEEDEKKDFGVRGLKMSKNFLSYSIARLLLFVAYFFFSLYLIHHHKYGDNTLRNISYISSLFILINLIMPSEKFKFIYTILMKRNEFLTFYKVV